MGNGQFTYANLFQTDRDLHRPNNKTNETAASFNAFK